MLLFLLGVPAAAVLGIPSEQPLTWGTSSESPTIATVQRPVAEPDRPEHSPSPRANGEQRWLLLQQRLQQEGALYYRQERVPACAEYHFICQVASSEPGHPPQTFESSGDDPLVILENVVKHVESWHQRR